MQKKKITNSHFLIFGNLWIFFLMILPLLAVVFGGLWRDCRYLSPLLLSLIVAFSSLWVTFVNYLRPRNPFEGNWLIQRTSQLTCEEEKVAQFLLLSAIAKKLVIKTGASLFALPFVFIFLPKMVLYSNNIVNVNLSSGYLLNLVLPAVVLYSVCSNTIFCFILERHIIFHWDDIQAMQFTPSRKYDQYAKRLNAEIGLHDKKSFLFDIASIVSNAPFNWALFLLLLFIGVSVVMICWGAGAFGFMFGKTLIKEFLLRLGMLVLGACLLSMAVHLWGEIRKKS